jgi:hypothetical protein
MVHILSSIEDEHCSSSIPFLKYKMCNCLNQHLELVVVANVCTKVFTLDNFSYRATNELWSQI